MDNELNIVAIVDSPESAEKLLAAGANKIIDPYEICGRKIQDMLKRPNINDIFDNTVFGRHDQHLAEVTIPENSYLENAHVTQLRLSLQYNLILIGIVNKQVSEQLYFVVEEFDHRLSVGDILVIFGPLQEIRALKKTSKMRFVKLSTRPDSTTKILTQPVFIFFPPGPASAPMLLTKSPVSIPTSPQ